jgi:3-hydroxyisobutyrate dehydrogenase
MPAARERAAALGIDVRENEAEVAQDVDVIVTCLPFTDDVGNMLNKEGGIFDSANKGTHIIDTSTILPDGQKKFAVQAAERGMTYMDTPMSGGVTGAEKQTLSFMIGGRAEDLETVRPVLTSMGKNLFHCGGPGSGGVAKLTNNLILAQHMIALSESLQIGEKLGGDPKILSDIFSVSTGRSYSVDTNNPVPGYLEGVPASRNYDAGFAVKLIMKDLNLALEAAKTVGASCTETERARDMYKDIVD